MEKKSKEKKAININPFVLIFCVVVVAGILSFIIPPGTLENGVYTQLPRNPLNFNNIFNIFRAIPYGIKDSANIMILILIVGGALEIYKRTGAIDNGISSMVRTFGGKSQMIVLIVFTVAFSVIGGFLGWIEVLIPFVPLVVAVMLAMGFDSLTAVAVCIIGMMAGFMAGPTNLLTVGVCSGVMVNMGIVPKDYDVLTGLEFRLVLWVIITVVSVLYIMRYAKKVQKNPEKSLVRGIDVSDVSVDLSQNTEKLTGRQIIVLLSIVAAMAMTVIGMRVGFNGVKWIFDDVAAIFLASGLLSGFVGGLKPGEIADALISGAKGSIGGGLVVGFARGVFWILDTAQVNATIIHSLTEWLRGTSPLVAAIGIILIVSLINGLIPSGSGKGALLAPILVPLGLELGLAPQATVLAYQFGDGITNMFWFSYGTLLIFLSYGKVPIQKWWRFFVPLMLIFFIIGFISVGVAINIGM